MSKQRFDLSRRLQSAINCLHRAPSLKSVRTGLLNTREYLLKRLWSPKYFSECTPYAYTHAQNKLRSNTQPAAYVYW